MNLIPFLNLIHFLKWDHLSRIWPLFGICSLPKFNPFSLVIIFSKAHEHKSACCRFYKYMNNPNCTNWNGFVYSCDHVLQDFLSVFFFFFDVGYNGSKYSFTLSGNFHGFFKEKMLEGFSFLLFCSEFKVLLLFDWLPPKATNPSLLFYLTCKCQGSRDELLLLKWP